MCWDVLSTQNWTYANYILCKNQVYWKSHFWNKYKIIVYTFYSILCEHTFAIEPADASWLPIDLNLLQLY